jgi:hypothetical protein
MANLFNMNTHININDNPVVSWKGKSFSQITSVIKKNANTKYMKASSGTIFLPNPLKIYRREIASHWDASNCNSRVSSSINEIDRPNGSLVYATSTTGSGSRKGLVNTLDINLTTNNSERPGSCSSCKTLGFSDADNAKRRCRSSGNIKRSYNQTTNSPNYFTDSKQYLTNRNRTFQQNQYYYLRQGNPNATPGDSLSVANLYAANGTAPCPKFYLASDVSFQYKWLDNQNYTVVIRGGNSYNTEDINTYLIEAMIANGHYYVLNNSYTKVFLMNISYNNAYGKIELQTTVSRKGDGTSTFPNSTYSYINSSNPATYNVGVIVQGSFAAQRWTDTTTPTSPQFVFNNTQFANMLGFNPNTSYPSAQTGNNANQNFLSPNTPLIGPSFAPIYYKPNNPQFAQQGAVSSSALTSRIKYDSITNSSAIYRNAYGLQVANALAYGVSENGYTIKDKIGYPNKKTPKVTSTGVYAKCDLKSFVHQI